ncbi:MAG: RHS repeat-associated core domain-containing protein [Chlamydiales bacterium]|nr:RHS repeat-associated core domain-containing protein [Chlamydiales bacterium]
MKYLRLLFLLLFIPCFLHAYDREASKDLFDKVVVEWKLAETLIKQVNNLHASQHDRRIPLLNEAIAACNRAIGHCDAFFKDYSKQPEKKRKESWRTEMKSAFQDAKEKCSSRISSLETSIRDIISTNLAFDKASTYLQEAQKRAVLAETKNRECPRNLNNVDVVVAALIEIAKLYEESADCMQKALSYIAICGNENDKKWLKKEEETYLETADKYRKEAQEWPKTVLDQKVLLKERLLALRKECNLLEEKGLKRSSYDVQKQILFILEQLSKGLGEEVYKDEITELKVLCALYETDADNKRLTKNTQTLTEEEFRRRENVRRTHFYEEKLVFPELFLPSLAPNVVCPFSIPLDGQVSRKEKSFTLYTEQFYRFLVQSDFPATELLVKIGREGSIVYEEMITLPLKNILSWEQYVRDDGMVFIPETRLKTEFGIDLRISFVFNPKCNFSMIITQKVTCPDHQLSFSLNDGIILYETNFLVPPPWQLSLLCKPSLSNIDIPIGKKDPFVTFSMPGNLDPTFLSEQVHFPLLDQFVSELQCDPMALSGYVQNEIALVDPFLSQDQGVFLAPEIQRSAYRTYLEKQGSPWEQCQLLVYLLRRAGHKALYAEGGLSILPKTFVEKMLFTSLPEGLEEGSLKYPFVLFSNGKEWITLFPWIKEMQVNEGYDLYNCMPEEYASADRWILHYLKSDENILKHIGPDGNDTAGVLFVRFVEEELRRQGLSLMDVGVQRIQLKKQFTSWHDFPRPTLKGGVNLTDSLKDLKVFATVQIEISSRENPQKQLSYVLPLADLDCNALSLRFSASKEGCHNFHVRIAEKESILTLDATDQLIDIKITSEAIIGTELSKLSQTLSFAKGTSAALCFYFSGASPQLTSQVYEQFVKEKEDARRVHALLTFVGTSYFEKCGRIENILADLHKTRPMTALAFGLAKLSPDSSKGPIKAEPDLTLPQVDMFWFKSRPLTSSAWNQEIHTANRQLRSLTTVDASSNEHQILKEVFKDPCPISTVKLLQLAHLQHKKNGLLGEGFIIFTPSSFESAENIPETAQALYFSHLENLNLHDVQTSAQSGWDILKDLLGKDNLLSSWSYAYMTPGKVQSLDGTYKEVGGLILNPNTQYALLTGNNLLFHGGLGSPLPKNFTTPKAISEWDLVLTNHGYALDFPPSKTTFDSDSLTPLPITTKWSSDVRAEHKTNIHTVADPIDVVSGAFYIDEVDLNLPGPFPFEIRRNYNSQNPLSCDFGSGWKLSLNPYLVEQDGKLYAAEADGSIIVYSYNQENSCWQISFEDNPDLCNFSQKGVGGLANPFHAYIKDNILYGTDGSTRYFENGLLKKWVDAKGCTLIFCYNEKHLSRIENFVGDFLGFHYNHEGKISEVYAKDGRRVSYNYDAQDNLIQVTLPNNAIISYEYDRLHRIIRETKPQGKLLENIYDDQGRVIEQRTPMGLQQELIASVNFTYQEGLTTLTDAGGAQTIYKIFQKQIYKTIDPLCRQTYTSWFIDEKTWFDPLTESVKEYNEPGAWPKSLKSTTDKRGLTTSYLYDKKGNPIEITLQGEDLTGNGDGSITKKLTYNKRNLCIQEEILHQKTLSIYLNDKPLPARIEKYIGNKLLSYIDLKYNHLGQVLIEDYSGAITNWEYNISGLPIKKIQYSNTNDPDIVTEYTYNHQGQCIQVISTDSYQQNRYDIMGNILESKVFSLNHTLLSAIHIGYNLNNQPIWRQTANTQNTLYLDYHASGLLKAKRQTLNSNTAYTLYEYDSRGNLIQEVDPRGSCTYRDYDLLGRVQCETREECSTLFTYESGGLLESVTSPSGAKTMYLYTTNGLLKEEIYPDGTRSAIIYDFFGRPVQETKNNITWNITFDDLNRKVIRTHLETTEVQEFDARGNLISFTDAAGYTLKRTYDALNRLKSETTPKGESTHWNYNESCHICTLPSNELKGVRYEGSRVVESIAWNAQREIIAHSTNAYDPLTDIQTLTQGDIITQTWLNPLGQPLKIQQGDIVTTYNYDTSGNCIAFTEGDARTTYQTYDALNRLIQKELPDGSILDYAYDTDSNLIETHLPNHVSWKARYDSMGRKCSEELQAKGCTSQHWEYTYLDGRLIQSKDPEERIHAFSYNPQGRLIQEDVEHSQRKYTYDPRGLCTSAQQLQNNEHSLIERSYDCDGNLTLESIYLNSTLLQQTHQSWTPSTRYLKIGDHERQFTYQNNQLVHVATHHTYYAYTYNLQNTLQSKKSPLSTTTIEYNRSSLPQTVSTNSCQESLAWDHSGKLISYSSPKQQKQFTYTLQGYLQSAGPQSYQFDFGSTGTGICTSSPTQSISQNDLDPFGRVIHDQNTLITYDSTGQVTSQNQKHFEWDPWGRLTSITDDTFTWKASYDAFGRRLQTHYTPAYQPTLTTTSFYDPETEFQEIGVHFDNKIFWKIYGPNSCDAVHDNTGTSLILVHNALDQLSEILSPSTTHSITQPPSPYGPQTLTPPPTDLLTYAQSLTWHSQTQDPTGLIWMGTRYYDPKVGRFLSPDPVGHPIALNLYTYANGDPINYFDPDGRCASYVYKTTSETIISGLSSPHFHGAMQTIGGAIETSIGVGITYATCGFAAPVGCAIIAHGLDQTVAGLQTAFSGRHHSTLSELALRQTGVSANTASLVNNGVSLLTTMGGSAMLQGTRGTALAALRSPSNFKMNFIQENEQILFGQKSVSAFFSETGTFQSQPISKIVQGLKNGTISSEALPLEIVIRNGQKITLNNRSLLALRRAKMEPQVIIDRTGMKNFELLLNKHLKDNLPSNTIKIRGGPSGTSLINP